MRLALVAVAALGCGRSSFDPLSDGAGSDHGSGALPVTHVGVFVARGSSASTSTDSFTAQAQQAGDAVVFHVNCNSTTAVSSVTFTAAGWTLVQLTSSFVNNGVKYAAVFGAIAPDANTAAFTITWPVVCFAHDEVGDEFANADPTGGTTTFHGLVASPTTGDCTATVVTSRDNDAVWGACSGGGTLTGVGAGYTKSADDLHDDWSVFRLTTDPAGTPETFSITNSLSTAPSVVTALTITAND